MQTDVVHVVVGCARRIHPTIGWSGTSVPVMIPPGTSRSSGDGTSSNDACARTSRKPDSSITGPAFVATNTTSASGSDERTWNGPSASREVKRS